MIVVAYSVPYWVLAAWRASQAGPLAITAQRIIAFVGYALVVSAFALALGPGPRAASGLAFLAVCGWSDLVARRIYLPVAALALVATLVAAALDHMLADALLGTLALGAASYAIYRLVPAGAWGFGDVLLALVVGAAFGLRAGATIFALAFCLGALIAGALIALQVIDRRAPLPLGTFVALGAACYAPLVHLGVVGS